MGALVTRRTAMAGAVCSVAAFATPHRLRAGPVTHEVQIQKFAFEPARITVKTGDKIKWTNVDLAPHTATADAFGWDTGELVRGQSGEVTVTADMETSYFCVFHPHMKGQIDIT